MPTLSYQTAGESHGPALVTIVTGLPAGVPLDVEFINAELARRQGGYGRGARQRIETDTVEILSGVRRGLTIASPLTLVIKNKDSRLDDLVKTPPACGSGGEREVPDDGLPRNAGACERARDRGTHRRGRGGAVLSAASESGRSSGGD